uniref:Uncharacterized protein n=1 Tax=Molossus molossus TaxID=27622 RepID=A0A7J8E388_MOLMO|nr:hypothetical protein HJG59_009055 [Molossus molossus]
MIPLLELLEPTLARCEIHERCRRGSWLRFIRRKALIELPRLLPDDQPIQRNAFLAAVADPTARADSVFTMNLLQLVTTCFASLLKETVAVAWMFISSLRMRRTVVMAGNLHNFLAIFDHIQEFHLLVDEVVPASSVSKDGVALGEPVSPIIT